MPNSQVMINSKELLKKDFVAKQPGDDQFTRTTKKGLCCQTAGDYQFNRTPKKRLRCQTAVESQEHA